ncbi:SDR family NAD(P)-dependent oxidoreductase [Pedobacter sp. L105]|uniref:SDR family NAD(P)-dependent oxidoreductase n=1 Tax=Pedobacter sp. L105 TaxID=1641871 RepID=UPI00131E8F79|nr:SDR family oxidoreductase [Pedobacter sp. L105]
MSKLIGKAALVTGGSRGIGAGIVKKLAAEGADVAFTYVSESSAEKADAIVAELVKNGTKALAIYADSGNPKSIAAAVKKAADSFGKLDILVSNAGIIVLGPIEQADELEEQYDRQLDINVRAIPAAVRAASKIMGDGGRIVIIGSTSGSSVGSPTATDYGATKAAAAAYARGYAWDLGAKGITVNVIQPGPVATDMNPDEGPLADYFKSKNALKRYGTVEEIAALVNFLVSAEAGFITGATINIDGGTQA